VLRQRSARRARSTVPWILGAPLLLAAGASAVRELSRKVMAAPFDEAGRRTGLHRPDLLRRAQGRKARVGPSTGNVLPPDRSDTGDIDSPRIDLVIVGDDPTVSLKPASPPASVNIS
jgi:hypothetical protein